MITLGGTNPDLPEVHSIAWLIPTDGVDGYRITFEGPLTPAEVDEINAYVATHDNIDRAEADPEDAAAVVVTCNRLDEDRSVLAWLHDGLMPALQITGSAQLCIAANPVVARIKLFGDAPRWLRQQLMRALARLSAIEVVHYLDNVKEIEVVFTSGQPATRVDALALAAILGLQRIAALTVMIDSETVFPPTIPAAEEE